MRHFYISLVVSLISVSTLVSANTNSEVFEEQEITISPSGELLAVQWFDSIAIFNLQSGERTHQFNAETEDPFVFTFNQDSSQLLSSGWEKISIWDVTTGTLFAQETTIDNAECGGFSKDQQAIYYDDEYNQFGQKQLTISNNDLSQKKYILKNSARCNASPDKSLLAIQTYNMAPDGLSLKSSEIQVINLNMAKKQNSLTGEKANAYDEDMFFFDDNRKLLVRDYSKFHIWDLKKNTVIRTWDSDIDIDEISISNNLLLLTADQQKRIWNLLEEPGPIETIPLPAEYNNILAASLSSDGKLYTITSLDENEQYALVSIFNTSNNELQQSIKIQTPISGAKFAKNDSILVLESYPIQVIDVATGQTIHQFTTHKK